MAVPREAGSWYHLIIKRKSMRPEIEYDATEARVVRTAEAYNAGKDFFFLGETINPAQIERIRIIRTQKRSSKFLTNEQKDQFPDFCLTEIISNGEDVSASLIKISPKNYVKKLTKEDAIIKKRNLVKEEIKIDRNIQYDPKKVFIVHGRHEQSKADLDRFLRKIGLEPIILAEQVNLGRNILDKFQDYASNVGYAFVLLTPDDKGSLKRQKKLRDRARQNVIFELGYFIATLGSKRVCTLYKKGVEIPSDITGMLYLGFDKIRDRHMDIVEELRAVGYKVFKE